MASLSKQIGILHDTEEGYSLKLVPEEESFRSNPHGLDGPCDLHQA